ncbi:MAG: prolyl oligopeptidase family serine peptidase [Gammaproteobacteria bacterium]|nr:prolyl oligopeptidase family serine peptidase [Gammaproteobacteria bacterium]MCW5582456.1 prolyl oligopeptidase family serine peptidase [Gammaproteobacteria bacterium]
MKRMVFYSCLIILFIFLLSLWGFYLAIRPIKITSPITPKTFDIDYEHVQFKTSDHILIKGWFIPNKNPHAKTIILLHGYPADKADILPSRLFLHKEYNLLFIDFRYLGESQGNYSTIGKDEVLDLRAALNYLHHRGIHEVGIWGFSLGAAVALLSAPEANEVKAIVAEAPFARLDWMAYDYYQMPGLNYMMGELLHLWAWIFLRIDIKEIRPVDSIKKLKVPLLLIYSKQDRVIQYQHALLMQQASQHNPYVEFILIDNTRHGEPMKSYQVKIKEFFSKNLGPET